MRTRAPAYLSKMYPHNKSMYHDFLSVILNLNGFLDYSCICFSKQQKNSFKCPRMLSSAGPKYTLTSLWRNAKTKRFKSIRKLENGLLVIEIPVISYFPALPLLLISWFLIKKGLFSYIYFSFIFKKYTIEMAFEFAHLLTDGVKSVFRILFHASL